ncbi:ATP-binding protein [Candidatus Woesearchaeota archaeon]|nr:ATP-binding protein [Candidatus Woesearchaeota archaeon]
MPKIEEVKKALIESNPWWKQKFDINYKDREIYLELSKYLDAKQIIALTGLRRVGKTTIMLKIVKDKINNGFDAGNIIYFSFDNFRDLGISELIEIYSENFEKDLTKQKFIFLLDEVQKVENWEEQIKRIYDLHFNFKIIVSGSESLFIRKKSRESLAGRMFEFKIENLSFKEFLSFKGKELKPLNLYEKELSFLFEEFMFQGGFPELVDIENKDFIKNYIRETVVEKILFRDIPLMFPIKDISVLESLFKIISSNPGQIIEMNKLAAEVGISRRVVSLYLGYLENSFLIKKIFNFSKNQRKTVKKLKKYYPAIPALGFMYGNEDIKPKIFENVLVLQTRANFFWRDAYKNEVDIVIEDKKILPIEVKYGEIKDLNGLLKFMKIFNINQGLVISKKEESKQKFDNKEVLIVPAWKWLLEK